eukprot:SAG11_NODE_3669_length_2296_cov_1.153846_2_plen_149_part_00
MANTVIGAGIWADARIEGNVKRHLRRTDRQLLFAVRDNKLDRVLKPPAPVARLEIKHHDTLRAGPLLEVVDARCRRGVCNSIDVRLDAAMLAWHVYVVHDLHAAWTTRRAGLATRRERGDGDVLELVHSAVYIRQQPDSSGKHFWDPG